MEKRQQKKLLRIARDAVTAAVKKEAILAVSSDEPELNANCGCFVTLKNHAELRGCIGQFTSNQPLIELVSEMAVSSATRDPRFVANQITADELEYIEIEISVLSPLKRTDDPASLRLGIDGIYITKGSKSGCFLPQVATETGWTEQQFLTNCCVQKAYLPADAWTKPETEVYLFTADIFGEKFADL